MNAPVRDPRVLVVEDDEEIAQVLQRSLRLEGYEVRLAADGEAALDDGRAPTCPTSSSSTSACRSSTAWRWPGACAPPTTCRSSC